MESLTPLKLHVFSIQLHIVKGQCDYGKEAGERTQNSVQKV